MNFVLLFNIECHVVKELFIFFIILHTISCARAFTPTCFVSFRSLEGDILFPENSLPYDW